MEISAARQLTVRGTRDSASKILLRLLVLLLISLGLLRATSS